jgi:hypothetical protein
MCCLATVTRDLIWRLQSVAALVAASALLISTSYAATPSRHQFDIGADLGFIDASGYSSWTKGSAGKLRHDPDDDGLQVSRAFADYRLRMADTVNLTVVAELYDDFDSVFDLTEAYVEWRPLTASANRYRFKLGSFYPRISLENTEAGWSSPYSITPSAINTWVGEEIRTLGAEVAVSRRPESLGGAHTFSLHAAAFYANDPAGTLLAWKGWSAHDRQTRWGDELPLPPVPQIQPGMFFAAQDPFTEPVRETDDAPGFYVGGEWVMHNRILVRAMHYDNRADPESYENGQSGWLTEFNHVGLQLSLPGEVGLIAQWMEGSTLWGPVYDVTRVIDADFQSHFVMLTTLLDRHRLSLRYDSFQVTDNDRFPQDDNSEDGDVWTLAYRYALSRHVTVAAEWLQIKTARNAWEYFGLNRVNTETQLQLSAQFRYGNHP